MSKDFVFLSLAGHGTVEPVLALLDRIVHTGLSLVADLVVADVQGLSLISVVLRYRLPSPGRRATAGGLHPLAQDEDGDSEARDDPDGSADCERHATRGVGTQQPLRQGQGSGPTRAPTPPMIAPTAPVPANSGEGRAGDVCGGAGGDGRGGGDGGFGGGGEGDGAQRSVTEPPLLKMDNTAGGMPHRVSWPRFTYTSLPSSSASF